MYSHPQACFMCVLLVLSLFAAGADSQAQATDSGVFIGCFARPAVNLQPLSKPPAGLTIAACAWNCVLLDKLPLSAWMYGQCLCGAKLPSHRDLLHDTACEGAPIAQDALSKDKLVPGAITLRYMHAVPGQQCALAPLPFTSLLWADQTQAFSADTPLSNITQVPTSTDRTVMLVSSAEWSFGMMSVVLTPGQGKGLDTRVYVASSTDAASPSAGGADPQVAIGFSSGGYQVSAAGSAAGLWYKAWMTSDATGGGAASSTKVEMSGMVATDGTVSSATGSVGSSSSSASSAGVAKVAAAEVEDTPGNGVATDSVLLSFTWQPTYIVYYVNGNAVYNVSSTEKAVPVAASRAVLSTRLGPEAAPCTADGCSKMYQSTFADIRRIVCGAANWISQVRAETRAMTQPIQSIGVPGNQSAPKAITAPPPAVASTQVPSPNTDPASTGSSSATAKTAQVASGVVPTASVRQYLHLLPAAALLLVLL